MKNHVDKEKWQRITPTLMIHYVHQTECCGVSINVDSGKFIILDLSDKPNIRVKYDCEFDSIEEAKDFAH